MDGDQRGREGGEACTRRSLLASGLTSSSGPSLIDPEDLSSTFSSCIMAKCVPCLSEEECNKEQRSFIELDGVGETLNTSRTSSAS